MLGEKVYLLSRLDPMNPIEKKLRGQLLPEGIFKDKNSDFLIGGKIYEGKNLYKYKGGTEYKKQKQAIENHIKKAKEQAPNFVLDIPEIFSENCITQTIQNYLNRTNSQRIIIVFHKGYGKVYKK